MNQKGFIPIIFIIIGAVVVASATFGVVKYKDEITASVVSIFERPRVKVPNIESTGGDELLEEPELVEEVIIEEEPKEEQEAVQQPQEQLRIAEQKPQEERPNSETKLEPEFEVDVIAPIISNINISEKTAHSAKITWQTNEITKCFTSWKGSILGSKSSAEWSKSHWVKLINLQANTTYRFTIIVQDKAGHETVAKREEFTTLDPCIGITCSTCHYCVNGKCIARPSGYNDCGSGCQRCVSGRCQDYNPVCAGNLLCGNDQCKLDPKFIIKFPEPKIENTPKTKGPCEGLDMRDFDWKDPLCKSDRQWQEKYECQQYLEKLFQQDLEDNPQLKKEYQKVQRMPNYIPPRSLPKNFGPQPF